MSSFRCFALALLGAVLIARGGLAQPAEPQPAAPAPDSPAAPEPPSPVAPPSAPEAPVIEAPVIPSPAQPPAGACQGAAFAAEPDSVGCKERPPPGSGEVPDVASLKTPESPAFMLLGTAPSEIQRPTTPTGLATSLANGFSDGKSLSLLRNFAIEFSPYWLFPRSSVAFERLQIEPERAWYRNLSISLASGEETVETGPAGMTVETKLAKLALGLRMTLWPGTPSRGARSCLQYLKQRLDELTLGASVKHRAFLNEYLSRHPEPAAPPRREPPPSDPSNAEVDAWRRAGRAAKEAYEREYAAWFAEYRTALAGAIEDAGASLKDDARYQSCLQAIHARAGFMAELAGAGMVIAPEGDLELVDDGGTRAATAWLTLGHVGDETLGPGTETSALLALRAGRTEGAIDNPERSRQLLDAGLRLALAFRRAGGAIEGTLRNQRDSDRPDAEWLYRLALSLDYRLGSGVWLTAAFGKDFGDTEEQTPLLALANVQWNFGLDRGVEIDRKVTE